MIDKISIGAQIEAVEFQLRRHKNNPRPKDMQQREQPLHTARLEAAIATLKQLEERRANR